MDAFSFQHWLSIFSCTYARTCESVGFITNKYFVTKDYQNPEDIFTIDQRRNQYSHSRHK